MAHWGEAEARRGLLADGDDDDDDLLPRTHAHSEENDPNLDQPDWFVKGQHFFLVLGGLCFLTSASFLPVFNKRLFNKDFHYPLFITSVYLLFCVIGGFSYFVLKYLLLICISKRQNNDDIEERIYYSTWTYWRNIVRATALLGVAFGVKLGLTNFGLDLVSVDYHVLFAATAIAWVAVIGYFLLKETPSALVWLVILCMITGQILLSLQFTSESQASVLGLAVNLMTPALQGVCVVLMRYSSLLLFPEWMTKHKDTSSGRDRGNNSLRVFNLSCIMLDYHQNFYFHVDTLIAYTTVKLLFSFLTNLPVAILKEGVFADTPFWDAITLDNIRLISADMAIGAVCTFFLQASLVLLSMLSVALTMGVLSVAKVIPQLAVGIWFSSKTFDASVMHVLGIVLILSSSVAYAGIKIHSERGK